MTFFRAIKLAFLLSLASLITIGCGDSGPPVGQVQGTVTIDGKPPGAPLRVSFLPSNGRSSSALSDSSGNYIMRFTARQDGAIVGEHEVRIEFMDTDTAPVSIPTRYNDNSTLTATVTRGRNTINFDIRTTED